MNEKLSEAIAISEERIKLRDEAQALQNKMEQLKVREKQAFGMCEGDTVTIPDMVQLIYRLMEQ